MKVVNRGNIIFLVILLLIIAFCYFIYVSPYFERKPPTIQTPSMSYWNIKGDLPITISDDSGIRYYEIVTMVDNSVVSDDKMAIKKDSADKMINLTLPIPKVNLNNGSNLTYKIIAKDWSYNHFFFGNKIEKDFRLIIDTKPPKVRLIQMSNSIIKGGSAAVVFYANDEALADVSLTNGFQSLVVFPFYKKNYYVGIIPWYIQNPTFKGEIIAMDKAGNTKYFNINFTRYNRSYTSYNVVLKNSFIDEKIAEIIKNYNKKTLTDFSDPIDVFKYVNETIRNNDNLIISEKILNLNMALDNLNAFKPLENAKVIGLFGSHVKFSFNKADAGESYHLGIDLSSTKNAPVIASNDGVVVMSEELGVYGNVIMIEHGYGLASLYGHLSEVYKKEGDVIKQGDVIGSVGSSGLTFGDNLLFEILIQGEPVMTNEWMDSKWLKTNIINVLSNAKEVIENEDAQN